MRRVGIPDVDMKRVGISRERPSDPRSGATREVTFFPSAPEGRDMADDSSDEDLARLVADLVRTLRELERELEPGPPDDGLRLPTPRDLRRLTSEVAIPGIILILETNIRALRLLQRALRLAEGADEAREETEQLRDRARSASESTLSRLDDALVELGDAIEGRPPDDEAADLLEEARSLRADIESRLRESATTTDERDGGAAGTTDESHSEDQHENRSDDDDEDGTAADSVGVDVDAELESIKRELDDLPGATDGRSAEESQPTPGTTDTQEPDSSTSDDESAPTGDEDTAAGTSSSDGKSDPKGGDATTDESDSSDDDDPS